VSQPPDRIIFGLPSFDDSEEQLLLQTLRSAWIGHGPLVELFEERLRTYVGSSHVVAVSSCTAAIHLALVAAGVGPGDEVITTPFTFVATVNAIEHTGATPVLVDIERDSLNLDAELVRGAVTERTRAIVPVHFGGRPVDLPALQRVADEHDLWVIEDSAHALGAMVDGVRIGGWPSERHVACFSFYPNKNVASAEGGAISTANETIARRIGDLRFHGMDSDAWNRSKREGYRPSLAHAAGFKNNWTDVQAAIALPQLEKLEGFLAIREYFADQYDEAFRGTGIEPVDRGRRSLMQRHGLHLYQVVVPGPPGTRDAVLEQMKEAGIGAAVHYIGVNQHPFYRDRVTSSVPNSDWASDALLTLPSHPSLDEDQVARVVTTLRAAVDRSVSEGAGGREGR
jgi:dTDP-4-amino-4,6-dideoxygalactose transaminase